MIRMLGVKSPYNWAISLIFFSLGLSQSLQAAFPLTSSTADRGPTAMSLGGASSASSFNLDSMTSNPAGLAYFLGQSGVGGSFQALPRDVQRYSFGVVDGSNGVMAGGLGFDWVEFGKSRRHNYTVGASYKTPYGSFGAAAHIQHYKNVPVGKGWHITNTMGILIPVLQGLTIGAYGHGFLDKEPDTLITPELHVGTMYSIPKLFRAAFDADKRFETNGQNWNYSLGGDFLFGDFYLGRGAYRWDNSTDYSYWSTGIGMISPRTEITGFYLQTTEGRKARGYGVDLNIRF